GGPRKARAPAWPAADRVLAGRPMTTSPPSPSYPDLADRAALVTGASSGIGRGIALALLEQGARVGVHFCTNAKAAEEVCAAHPGRAFPLQADLSGEAGCVALARATRAALGGCDVLVHAAGIWNAAPIAQLSAARLEEMFRVNAF